MTTTTATDVDPLLDLRHGDRIPGRRYDGDHPWISPEDGVECTVRIRPQPGVAGQGVCSRRPHPPTWAHIAVSGDVVCGIAPPEMEPEELKPDKDGEVEPIETAPVEVGDVMRFRNKRDVLYVVGTRRDDRVEVLDLTHEDSDGRPRFRLVRREQLIKRKDDAEPLTREQMTRIARHMADQREKTRTIAVRELRNGRFNATTLNNVLSELAMEPYVPQRTAQVSMSGQVIIEKGGPHDVPDRYEAGRAVQKALETWWAQMTKDHPIPGVRMSEIPLSWGVGSAGTS